MINVLRKEVSVDSWERKTRKSANMRKGNLENLMRMPGRKHTRRKGKREKGELL